MLGRMTRRVALSLLLALTLASCGDDQPTADSSPSTSISASGAGTDNTLHAQSDATTAQLDAAKKVVLARLKALGHSDAQVEVGRRTLEIRGPQLTQPVLRMLARTGRLEFRGVVHTAEPAATAMPSGGPSAPTGWDVIDCTDPGERLAATDPPRDREVPACSRDGKVKYVLGKVELSGDAIVSARAEEQSSAPNNSSWHVFLTFDSEGAKALADVTERYVGKVLAIVLDGVLQSAPTVNDRIDGGEAQISGDFTEEEARTLAAVLSSDEMPILLLTSQLP